MTARRAESQAFPDESGDVRTPRQAAKHLNPSSAAWDSFQRSDEAETGPLPLCNPFLRHHSAKNPAESTDFGRIFRVFLEVRI